MKVIQRIKKRFWISVVLLSIMSLVILVVPLVAQDAVRDTFWPIAIALLFWLLAALGYWTIILANNDRKKFLKKRFGRDTLLNFRPGLLCFFSNPIAIGVDIAFIVATLSFIVAMITPLQDTYIVVVFLFLFIWTTNMHCLFNGRTFRMIKYEIKRGKKS